MNGTSTASFFKAVSDALLEHERNPHGPPVQADEVKLAGDGCVRLCDGDQDKARTLWKLIARDCGGYMPRAAAVALIRASNTANLVPDVEAPVPT